MPAPSGENLTQTVLRLLFLTLLLGGSIFILAPFVLATIWAIMIVIPTWPFMIRMERVFRRRRGLAVAAMSVLLMLIFFVPFVLAATTLFEHSGEAIDWLQSFRTRPLPQAPAWLGEIPVLGSKLTGAWTEAVSGGADSLVARAVPYIGNIFNWFMGTAGSLGMLVVQFLLTIVISSMLYANGEVASRTVLAFGRRLAGAHGEGALILASKAIRGIAMGVVLTALAQTAASGLGMAIAGIPAASLLTVVVFVLCIAQIGPLIILLAATGWLYWSGDRTAATLLLIYSIPVGAMDNFLRPFLIMKEVDLPLPLIMVGVIGGLMAFGIVGIFVGPIVLAVAYTLSLDWIHRKNESGAEFAGAGTGSA